MSECSSRSNFAADLANMFADTAVTVAVTFGAAPTTQSTHGVLQSIDVPEPDGQGGIVIVSRRSVTIQDDALTDLEEDLEITVDGTTYTIHGVRDAGRGRTRIILA
jgi:hypothetical protein